MPSLKRTSMVARLVMSNIAFAIPVLVMITLTFQSETANIEFGQQEVRGNQYQRPLMSLLARLSVYRLTRDESKMVNLKQEIEQDLVTLSEVDQRLGEGLQFTPDGLAKRKRELATVAQLKASWQALRTEADQAALIAHVRTMITHMGDTSNLILDPDLDSYYLMDVTLLAVPQLMDRLQDMAVYVQSLPDAGRLDESQKIKLAGYASWLKDADLERIKADIQTVLNEDPQFYGKIPSLHEELPVQLGVVAASVNKVITTLDGVVRLGQLGSDRERLRVQSILSIRATQAFWDHAVGDLDSLIGRRLDSLAEKRSKSVLMSLGALLFACLVTLLIGKTFRDSMAQILAGVLKIRSASREVAVSSQSLVSVSDQVSSATTEQAAAVQETVATLSQITAMASRSQENVGRSFDASARSSEVASQGQQAVEEMTRAIQQISDSNQQILQEVKAGGERFSEVVTVIQEIASKTRIINDIVFQTKLLSFNASVEAARAGEHGKGFSVVAQEIGNLAQVSGGAAREIEQLVGGSIDKVKGIVVDTQSRVERFMKQGSDKVDEGVSVAQRCASILTEVVNETNQVKEMMGEVTSAANEQAQGVSNISSAMSEFDESTHANAGSARETSRLAQGLADKAAELTDVITALEVEVSGKSQAGEEAPNAVTSIEVPKGSEENVSHSCAA